MKDQINVALAMIGSVLGIETISLIQLETSVKIICQIIITGFTVYYLLTKTNNHKNEKHNN